MSGSPSSQIDQATAAYEEFVSVRTSKKLHRVKIRDLLFGGSMVDIQKTVEDITNQLAIYDDRPIRAARHAEILGLLTLDLITRDLGAILHVLKRIPGGPDNYISSLDDISSTLNENTKLVFLPFSGTAFLRLIGGIDSDNNRLQYDDEVGLIDGGYHGELMGLRRSFSFLTPRMMDLTFKLSFRVIRNFRIRVFRGLSAMIVEPTDDHVELLNNVISDMLSTLTKEGGPELDDSMAMDVTRSLVITGAPFGGFFQAINNRLRPSTTRFRRPLETGDVEGIELGLSSAQSSKLYLSWVSAGVEKLLEPVTPSVVPRSNGDQSLQRATVVDHHGAEMLHPVNHGQ